MRRGEVAFLRERNRSLETWARDSPLATSSLVGLMVTRSFLETERRIAEITAAAVDADLGELSFEAAGPPHHIETAGEAVRVGTALCSRPRALPSWALPTVCLVAAAVYREVPQVSVAPREPRR